MRDRAPWRRWLRLRRDPAVEFEDELRFHLEQRVRDHIARGMDPEAARRAAHERMGDVGRARAECATLLATERRAAGRRRWLNVSWLDVKLGVRMLVKHPGLTVLGGLGMAVAIAIGASAFSIIYTLLDPSLPLEDGDRVVAIDGWDARTGNTWPIPLHDVAALRENLRSFEDIAAYRRVGRNVIGEDARVESLRVTEMNAAGFDVDIAALGADPRVVLRGVLARAVRQVAVGAGIGLVGAVGVTGALGGELLSPDVLVLLLGVCAIVLVVGVLAALGPARQGLRIQPNEALREL
jgi:hypothetical protein